MKTDSFPTICVGLIGCGDISRAHLETYQKLGCRVAALCDLDGARAEARRQQYGLSEVRIFTNAEDLLRCAEIELVTVATPVHQHAPLTLAALAAGKHVACEKPSALTLRENRAILEAARRHGRQVIFFSGRMRHGATGLAREYIESGELGEIYRVNVRYYRSRGRPGVDMLRQAPWFAEKAKAGGGVVMDMGQYFMDLVFHLTHWPQIKTVSGWTFQGFPHDLPPGHIYDVEEHCTLLARTEGPAFVFDFANIAHAKGGRQIVLLGTKGGLCLDDEGYFRYYTEKGGPWKQIEHTSLWRDKENGNEHCYEQLIKAIRGQPAQPGTTPEEALQITLCTLMAYRSAELGREVTPDEIEPLT